MDNSTRRRMRIDQIFKKISEEKAVNKEDLISWCSVHFGLARRTTREYINDLCNLKLIKEEEEDLIPLKKMPKQKSREEGFDEIIKKM
ncbi:MAG TPA: hypothetical protein DCS66_14965 [Flavobacteriaceae bacterium]|nr:hypothetical protein [Flavobacteriaceae bacterium]